MHKTIRSCFHMQSTYAIRSYLAVSCWYEVLPPNSIYRHLLQCFIIWKFENMYFRTTRAITLATRPVTSLGHQGGEEFSERGPHFLNYAQYFKQCPTHFSRGWKNFVGGASPSPWLRSCLQRGTQHLNGIVRLLHGTYTNEESNNNM